MGTGVHSGGPFLRGWGARCSSGARGDALQGPNCHCQAAKCLSSFILSQVAKFTKSEDLAGLNVQPCYPPPLPLKIEVLVAADEWRCTWQARYRMRPGGRK
jgi:hypothetical protein